VSSASSGKSILSISSLISVNTFLVFASFFNSTITELIQTDDVEVIFLIPSIDLIPFSIFSVIRESISFGFTQIYGVVIQIIPNLISGLDSFGIVNIEKIPAASIKNTARNETLYLLTQNQKNQDSSFSFNFIIVLFIYTFYF
jgi:hypothetical protein